MKAHEVRKAFLSFFGERGHEIVPSSSLVPHGDPTLLFTNAGMVQFKDVFTGREARAIRRAASSQKCVRAGGKHNDLDEVGKTPRHQTFFEMLGNFSFGDYFKQDAIAWAWELLTQVFGLDQSRLVVTIFSGDEAMGVAADDEARAIWADVTGFGPERIIGLGKSENFWMMGDIGPMGPCSEIHYFMGEGAPGALPTSDAPATAWDSWLEIWNLVFMQYERKEKDGTLDPLPAPSIDTGAGLERVTSVLQGVRSNYDTDLLRPLIDLASEIAGKKYGEDDDADMSMRVIADHARATAFLVADGVFPDKSDKEYVLRRIFRRAVRHGKRLGIEEPFMHRVCERVVEEMHGAYPDLRERASVIAEVTLEEERRFRATLDRGLNLLEDEFERLRKDGESEVPGAKVFQLYDTFGFPEDLTEIIAGEHGFQVDAAGFAEEMERARQRSKDAHVHGAAGGAIFQEIANDIPATEFLGYAETESQGQILALIRDDARVQDAGPGRIALVCDRTPFYAESGGQIGDTGAVRTESGALVRITDTRKPAGDVFVHFGEIESGTLKVGDTVTLAVDAERRDRIRANHSATHLLHLALKQTLGAHVAQKGSLVAPDRLRFDFSHFSPMTEAETREIEDWVNTQIRANTASKTEVLPVDEAKKKGAVAMFGEKYGADVRVVRIGDQSLEFCGGTHVARAGDIGLFKILSESSVAQGVRRVEAVTGAGALEYVRKVESELSNVGQKLKVAPLEVGERVARMQTEIRSLEREIAALKGKLAAGGARDLMADVQEIGGVKVLATATEVADMKTLRETGDTLRDRLGSGVLFLVGSNQDKVSMVAMVTSDLADRLHAGRMLQAAAPAVGGRGGGRPEMAQGGGKDPGGVSQAIEAALGYIRETVEA